MEDDEDENNEKDFRRSKRRNERRELLTTTLQQGRTNDEKYATKGVKVESDAENASETNGGSAAAAAAAKEKMFQILRDSASWDPDVEKLLEGIDASDPDAIEQAIRKRFDEKKSGVYKPLETKGQTTTIRTVRRRRRWCSSGKCKRKICGSGWKREIP